MEAAGVSDIDVEVTADGQLQTGSDGEPQLEDGDSDTEGGAILGD